jgi:ribosome-associated protein
MQEFELEGRDYIELNNLLKITGLCESGGVAKNRIAEGQVKVDNKIELRKRCKVRTGQIIEFNEQKVQVN